MKPTELRKIRERLKMTQQQLASSLGVTSNTVARWERGERKIPKIAKLAVDYVVLSLDAVTFYDLVLKHTTKKPQT